MKKRVDFRLYLITDRRQTRGRQLEEVIEEALKAGVKAVQIREKDMKTRELLSLSLRMKRLTEKYGAKLFVNDRLDIALASGADGVHLGQRSIPPHAVRKACGGKILIGVSTHSAEEALKAQAGGADFITFGPVFKTPSKLSYGEPVGTNRLGEAAGRTSIPVFAIGGIKAGNAPEALMAGAKGIALISAITASPDVGDSTSKLIGIIE